MRDAVFPQAIINCSPWCFCLLLFRDKHNPFGRLRRWHGWSGWFVKQDQSIALGAAMPCTRYPFRKNILFTLTRSSEIEAAGIPNEVTKESEELIKPTQCRRFNSNRSSLHLVIAVRT